MESLELGNSFFLLTGIYTLNWIYNHKANILAELIVKIIYTWEEYAGNQNNLLWVGSPETRREAPFIFL